MKRELHIFLTAVMFYTRIPCPRWVDHNPEYINLSTRYFPIIGWIVGGLYGAVVLICSLVFTTTISVLLGLGFSVLVTGAFHEDGLADVCDGFGGGWTKEKILMIMKDSRVGTYGVIGIILAFALKIVSTIELFPLTGSAPVLFLITFISAHSLSRAMAVGIIYFQTYAREDKEDSKAKPVAAGISLSNFLLAITFGIVPFVYFLSQTSWFLSAALLPMALLTTYLARYFKKWIGGYTGDCLGATQQLTELIFLLSLVAIWKFI